ncbi:uncharacterized protein PHALS_03869 [Plasmopara halstedii]|uniref:Uncharacterized protein n=1 Tax=Plasmopara halstedii TaxID=4781 RepID=A0A0P1AZX5_PLAHL|nr:uncharacterized protein PHALS_03869 [Plasmopara halstedii]CEG47221.1 hypothetical protein PHALS_03869 [Plasmopara halstedii]|eukprot:XP_024583590.1 hypothetical protein PHALS_03869 [Plasmopara halstedii]
MARHSTAALTHGQLRPDVAKLLNFLLHQIHYSVIHSMIMTDRSNITKCTSCATQK